MMTEPVHLLARRTGSLGDKKAPANTVWLRCGRTMRLPAEARLPAIVTAASGKVTCPGCLEARSWRQTNIPV